MGTDLTVFLCSQKKKCKRRRYPYDSMYDRIGMLFVGTMQRTIRIQIFISDHSVHAVAVADDAPTFTYIGSYNFLIVIEPEKVL